MIAFPAAHGPRWLVLAILAPTRSWWASAIMLFDVTTGAFYVTDVPRDDPRPGQRVDGDHHPGRQGARCARRRRIGTAYGVRPALWVAAVGATTTVLWTWFSPLRSTE